MEKRSDLLTSELVQLALDVAGTGITIADARVDSLPIIYANKYFQTMTGYALNEIIGKNCRFLQGDLGDQESLVYLREALKDKEPCKVRIKNFRKDGTLFWNELNITPVFDANGELEYYIGVQKDITNEMQYQEQLIELAERDSLTLVLNTRTFFDYAMRLMKVSLRTGQPFGIGVIDIHNFKRINDRYGHMLGDEVLQSLARRLIQAFRGNDVVGRLGGDEFMISCISNTLETQWFYDKVLQVEDSMVRDYNFDEKFILSAGYTVAEMQRDTDIKDLLRTADQLMYKAKRAHKA